MEPIGDAVVVGAGPGGAVCAGELARAGIAVTLIAAGSRHPADGEVLKPVLRQRLESIGLWERVRATVTPLVETVSAWGSPDPAEIPSVLDPYGDGWVVDRGRFDRALLDAAVDAGARLVAGHVETARHGDDCRWTVVAGSERGEVDVSGRWLVDATGRAAGLVRRHGVRIRGERLAATGRRYAADRLDARLLIESVPTGWWYSLPSVDGALVAVHVAAHPLPADDWDAAVSAAPLTAARIASAAPRGEAWVRPAGSALSSIGTPDLLAVGDAMASFDPVTGDGLSFAVVSGVEAAATIAAALRGDHSAPGRYLRGAGLLFARYRAQRREVYGAERRWPDTPFWSTQRAA